MSIKKNTFLAQCHAFVHKLNADERKLIESVLVGVNPKKPLISILFRELVKEKLFNEQSINQKMLKRTTPRNLENLKQQLMPRMLEVCRESGKLTCQMKDIHLALENADILFRQGVKDTALEHLEQAKAKAIALGTWDYAAIAQKMVIKIYLSSLTPDFSPKEKKKLEQLEREMREISKTQEQCHQIVEFNHEARQLFLPSLLLRKPEQRARVEQLLSDERASIAVRVDARHKILHTESLMMLHCLNGDAEAAKLLTSKLSLTTPNLKLKTPNLKLVFPWFESSQNPQKLAALYHRQKDGLPADERKCKAFYLAKTFFDLRDFTNAQAFCEEVISHCQADIRMEKQEMAEILQLMILFEAGKNDNLDELRRQARVYRRKILRQPEAVFELLMATFFANVRVHPKARQTQEMAELKGKVESLMHDVQGQYLQQVMIEYDFLGWMGRVQGS